MQFRASERDLKAIGVPSTTYYHEKAKGPVASGGLMVLNGILRIVGLYRSLLFFGVVGSLFLLCGLACGIWVVDICRGT